MPSSLPRRIALLTVLFLTALGGACSSTASAKKPNIVLFLVDDMGPMDTSVPFVTDDNGNAQRYPLNDYYRTPAMEQLARQGVRLNNFYAMSVCSPTRTSILTGQNATRHGVTQWIRSEANNRGKFGPPEWNWTGFANADATLPGVLKTVGYRTMYVGKAHFGPSGEPAEHPKQLGYDDNVAGCSWGQPGSYYGKDGYGHLSGNARRAVPDLEQYHGTDTFLTEALTAEAKKMITAANENEQPFFLHFAPYALHAPFQSNPRYAANYAASGKSKKAQAYATLVESMDTALSRLMAHLEAEGIAEDTLIVFVGDNGGDAPLGPAHQHHSSFPLRGKKGTHYEGGMRVPFLAAWAKLDPGNPRQLALPIAQGAIQQQLGAVMDVYPTLLNLAGAEAPAGHVVDGQDLAQQLCSVRPNPDREERFLMHYPHGHRSSYYTALRMDGWKLVYHYLPDKNPAKVRYELFHLEDDPFEKVNLATEQPTTVKRLMQAMIAQLENEQAQYPVDAEGKPMLPVVPGS